jgi:hypothetical protein
MGKFGWSAAAVAAVAVAAMLAPSAQAQALSRQTGASFQFLVSDPKPAEGVIAPGQTVATFVMRERNVVRLIDPTLPRPSRYGAPAPGAAAGAFLYAVTTKDEREAFCTYRTPETAKRQQQCYLDLQNNGVFVAGYMTSTGNEKVDARMDALWLVDLVGVPPARYEKVEPRLAPTEVLTFRFKGWRGKQLLLDRFFGEEKAWDEPVVCDIGVDKPCELVGGFKATIRREGPTAIVVTALEAPRPGAPKPAPDTPPNPQ